MWRCGEGNPTMRFQNLLTAGRIHLPWSYMREMHVRSEFCDDGPSGVHSMVSSKWMWQTGRACHVTVVIVEVKVSHLFK